MTPQLLKSGVTTALWQLVEPIQKEFLASPEWQEIERKAYPPPEVKKKEKKVKDKGNRYPGGAKPGTIEARPDGHIEGEGKAKIEVGTSAAAALEHLKLEKGA